MARTSPRRVSAPFRRLTAPVDGAGLVYVADQPFGVELEFASPLGAPDRTGLVYSYWKWKLVAMSLIRAIESAARLPVDPVPRNYHEVDDADCWRVEFDRSVGWEVVSPILRNQEGFVELAAVMRALGGLMRRSPHLQIDHTAGLHVSLGSPFTSKRQAQGFEQLVRRLEPGLFTLVSPHRLYEWRDGVCSTERNNAHCRPLGASGDDDKGFEPAVFGKKSRAARYRTVNLSERYRGRPRIEVRLHHGTTDASAVLAWISLWMTLVHQARAGAIVDECRAGVFPGGNVAVNASQARREDLFELLDRAAVEIDPRLRERLDRTRRRLFRRWKKVLPRRVQSWRRSWRPSALVETRR